MPAKSDRHLLETDWISEWQKRFRQRNKRILNLFKPNLKQKERAEYMVSCPCCKQQVRILEQHGLQDLNDNFVKALEALITPTWFTYSNGDLFDWVKVPFALRDWACDACITAERAEIADFETIFLLNLQSSGGHRPYFYFDYGLQCSTCQIEFIYSKGQQRWAHQAYIISGYSALHDCRDCRKTKNQALWQKQMLQNAITLARAEPSFENLFNTSQLLLENADPRALEFLRQAKNKAPSLEQKAHLENQIRSVE